MGLLSALFFAPVFAADDGIEEADDGIEEIVVKGKCPVCRSS